MDKIENILNQLLEEKLVRMIISNPRKKSEEIKKIVIRLTTVKGEATYQIERYTNTQVFHENVKLIRDYVINVKDSYRQIDMQTDVAEYIILIGKAGNATCKANRNTPCNNIVDIDNSHNKKKNYILQENMKIQPLIDLGVMTKEGKIINSKYDKFKQINRFIEFIDDVVAKDNREEFNIIDFGCGKSYLTFIIYYYLTEIKGRRAKILGLDLKKEVIKHCNEIAEKYGYKDLTFECGDIKGYEPSIKPDMVISLHACNTATDYALFNAIQWKADYIFSVPCCQHELNDNIVGNRLTLFTDYGIIKERIAALATDSIRGKLLEYAGYYVQLLEFIDIEHSPKNILIRARKKNAGTEETRQKALTQIEEFIKEFGYAGTLYDLLIKNK